MGKMFANWLSEASLIEIMKNWPAFSDWVLGGKPIYIHGGHLIDRAGYAKFKDFMLKGVDLNPEAMIAENMNWAETDRTTSTSGRSSGMRPWLEGARPQTDPGRAPPTAGASPSARGEAPTVARPPLSRNMPSRRNGLRSAWAGNIAAGPLARQPARADCRHSKGETNEESA